MSIKKILYWIEHQEIGKWSTFLFITSILVIGFIMVSSIGDGLDALFDRTPDTIIVVQESTKVYKSIDSNEVITILNKGDKVKSLYRKVPKSGLYYRIRL